MKLNHFGCAAAMGALTALIAPLAVFARSPYADARSYLQTAQMLMRVPQQPNVQLTLLPADDDLTAAIREIDVNAAPVAPAINLDTNGLQNGVQMDNGSRFRSIVDLLDAARAEMKHQPGARAVIRQIDTALADVHRAARDGRLDRSIGSY